MGNVDTNETVDNVRAMLKEKTEELQLAKMECTNALSERDIRHALEIDGLKLRFQTEMAELKAQHSRDCAENYKDGVIIGKLGDGQLSTARCRAKR